MPKNKKTAILPKGFGEFLGYPIKKGYKYLGCILDQKLNGKKCFKKSTDKINHIKATLSPMLSNCTLEYRKNIWQIFIQPLCDFVTPYHFFERSKDQKNFIKTIIRKSFKSKYYLNLRIPNNIIEKLMGYKINERADNLVMISDEKNRCRREGVQSYKPDTLSKYKNCLYQPKKVIEYPNLAAKQCLVCKNKNPNIYQRLIAEHLRQIHCIKIKTFDQILDYTKVLERDKIMEYKAQKRKYGRISK